jgi:putative two-component system response regulator
VTVPAPQARVLVVDDQPANTQLLSLYLSDLNCEVEVAWSGVEALRRIEERIPDLVLLDVQMPEMDGLEVCRRLKASWTTRLMPVVMVTALNSLRDRVLALEAGADDFLTKPVARVELRARVTSLLRVSNLLSRLDSTEHVIFALARAVEAKDKHTEIHTARVAATALALGQALGLDDETLDSLFRGGLVHDIGKIGVPDAILQKPGPLDPREREIMERHPTIGEEIVRPLQSAGPLRAIIRHHHEWVDGSGYPDHLRGEKIPLLARIVSVCDGYDAMTSDRPYRPGRSVQEAIRVLMDGAGSQWDKTIVGVFREAVVDPDHGLRFGVPDLLKNFDQRGLGSPIPAKTA